MSEQIKNRDFFHSDVEGPMGILFRTGNKPKSHVFKSLFKSILFKLEVEDTAQTDKAGHVMLELDGRAINRDLPTTPINSNFSRVVQAHQLSNIYTELLSAHTEISNEIKNGLKITTCNYLYPGTTRTRKDYIIEIYKLISSDGSLDITYDNTNGEIDLSVNMIDDVYKIKNDGDISEVAGYVKDKIDNTLRVDNISYNLGVKLEQSDRVVSLESSIDGLYADLNIENTTSVNLYKHFDGNVYRLRGSINLADNSIVYGSNGIYAQPIGLTSISQEIIVTNDGGTPRTYSLEYKRNRIINYKDVIESGGSITTQIYDGIVQITTSNTKTLNTINVPGYNTEFILSNSTGDNILLTNVGNIDIPKDIILEDGEHIGCIQLDGIIYLLTSKLISNAFIKRLELSHKQNTDRKLIYLNGHDDWFLPSVGELGQLIDSGVFHFENKYYASSSELYDGFSFGHSIYAIYDGAISEYSYVDKSHKSLVVPVRTFTIEESSYSLNIGDYGDGGIVFYRETNSGVSTYYECYPEDIGEEVFSNISDEVGTSNIIGAGKTNTEAIINQVGHTNSCAKLCDDLVTIDEYAEAKDIIKTIRTVNEITIKDGGLFALHGQLNNDSDASMQDIDILGNMNITLYKLSDGEFLGEGYITFNNNGNTVIIVSQHPSGGDIFSNTKDNGSTFNVYYETDILNFQNKTGSNCGFVIRGVRYNYTMIGFYQT